MIKKLAIILMLLNVGLSSFSQYCTPSVLSPGVYFLTSVKIDGATAYQAVFPSTGIQGYNDLSANGPFDVCTSFPFKINASPGFVGQRFSVWIDWNQDNVFQPGEMVVPPTFVNITSTVNIPIPAGALLGTTRMRVLSTSSTATDPCTTTQPDGTIADFTINITCVTGAVTCSVPTGVRNAVTQDSITGVCGNQTIWLSVDTNLVTPTGTYTFDWWWGDGSEDTTFVPNNSHTFVGNGPFDLWLALIDSCGVQHWYDLRDFGIFPSGACFTGPASACIGERVTFNSICSGTAAGGIWDTGDGTPIDTAVNLQYRYTYTVPGVYNVIMTDGNCESVTQPITINDLPNANFSLANPGCPGTNTSFTDLSTPGGSGAAITGWAWDFGDIGSTSAVQSPNYNYSGAGVYSPLLIVTDANGCENNAITTFQVGDSTLANFTTSAGCPCNNVTFNAIGGAISWSWNFGDGTTDNTQNPIHTYAGPGDYWVTLTVVDGSGCIGEKKIKLTVCGADIVPSTSKSNNNWVFGPVGGGYSTGISFSSGAPLQTVPDPLVPTGNDHHTATVSDPVTGDILFYCSGRTVWDKNYAVMSTGVNSQQPLIVPKPGNVDQYYVFSTTTLTQIGTAPNTTYWSLVDMSLNGGLGQVSSTNNILTTSFARKITAIKKKPDTFCSPAEYWVTVYSSIPPAAAQYKTYLIDVSGINLVNTQTIGAISVARYGASFTPDGTKFAAEIDGGVEIFDFDINTGLLSNPVKVNKTGYISFSPNSRFMYVSGFFGTYQYDMLNSSIVGSEVQLGGGGSSSYLGDDDKVYIHQGNGIMSVVNNPDLPGLACNYVVGQLVFAPSASKSLGSQTNNIVKLDVSQIMDSLQANFTVSGSCLVLTLNNLSDSIIPPADPCSYVSLDTLNYLWSFGDGYTSTVRNPIHAYLGAGTYTVKLVVNRPFQCSSDSMEINVTVAPCCVSTSKFVKTYGEGVSNWVEQTSDCGYIIAGHTTASGAGGWDAYLIKTDANGDLMWSKTYGGASNDEFSSVIETSDGGYIALGQALSFGAGGGDMYLVKMDATGTLQWSKTYGGPEWDWGTQVRQLPDGGYILAGMTFSYELPGTIFDGYVVRINSVGDTLWTSTLHANGSSFGNGVMGVELNSSGNFIVGGVTQTTSHHSWLIELDGATGNIIWANDYEVGAYAESYYPHQLPSGGYLYSGFSQAGGPGTNFVLKETDPTGNIVWSKAYGGAGGDAGRDMELTSDGGSVMVGTTTSFGYGGQDFMMIKVDNTGTPQFTKTYGGCLNETRPAIKQTTDGGYIISGATESFSPGGIILIKTDASGDTDLSCFEMSPTPNVQNLPVTENPGAIQQKIGEVNTIPNPGVAALIDTLTPSCIFIADFVADTVCFTNITTFLDTSSNSPEPCSWLWDFADPASGGSNSSILQNPTHTFTSAGTFNVTLTTTWIGGASVPVTIAVLVNPIYSVPQAQSICLGDSILLGGVYQTLAGVYTDSLLTINNCDSIINTTLTIDPNYLVPQIQSICAGDSIQIGGIYQSIAGVYDDSLVSALGCDSIIQVTLTINPLATSTATTAICQGDSVLLGGVFQSTAGVYNDTIFGGSSLGCDSIVTTTLTINPLAASTATTVICQGDSILLGGIFQTTAGIYNDTIFGGSGLGCDSIVTTTLTVNPLATGADVASICQGDSILLGGSFQTIAGNYNDTIFGGSGLGCDSIVTTTLTINPLSTGADMATICQGDSILLGGSFQTIAGNYNDTIFGGSGLGCDSIVTTTLTINPLAIGVDVASICQGDSILLGGSFQTIAGNYNDTIFGGSGLGCDSIVTTTLTINPLATSTATAAICPGDSILLGGSFQTIAGNYNDTIIGGSGLGCDSIVTTTLSINPLATSTDVASRCDGDSILLGGSYQYASGVFVDTLFGASFLGCDSVITTTLTFFPTDNASFTYPDTAYCENATNPLPTGVITPGGAFTIDNGGVINATTGEVDLQNSGIGTFNITYTTTGGCFGATTETITINPSDDAAFSFANSTYCSNEINPTPTVSGTPGGVFTISNGGVINPSTGEVDLATSGVGPFVITYTTSGICFDSETASITIENCSPPIADFTINDSIICEGDCIDLVNTSQFATALLWTIPGGTPDSSTSMTPTICFPNGGNFVVTLTVMNQFGTSTKTMTVKVNANPIIDAGSDVTIPLGATTQLFVTGANSYSWSPSIYLNCSMCEDPVAAPPATTPFIVIAVDDNGCEGRDTVIVIIDGEIDIFIPNVFSPNGDGENDMFRVFGSSFPEKYSMKIYNRWGGLVFESEDENTVWDGRDKKGELFPQAVFVYNFLGTTVSGQYIERNGNVMLAR